MFEPLIAAFIVALVSLSGIVLFRTSGYVTGTHRFMLPFAVGVFLGIVFLELVPETLEAAEVGGPIAILAGFFGFYLLSHLLRKYHHHHHQACEDCVGSEARMLLIGDAIHNVADGIVLTSAFLIDPVLGVVTTAGIILHELPQEIAEFSVLVASGYSRTRALTLNFISALSIVVGVLLTLFFVSEVTGYVWVLTGIAAGNLLYIATSDLIPELDDEHKGHFWRVFAAAMAGLALITLTVFFSHSLEADETPERPYEYLS